MQCPFCAGFISRVVDKRAVKRSGEIRRRRECLKCKQRFTTYEQAVVIELMVIKKDGRLEPFDTDKIKRGLERALEKRPGFEQVDSLADKIGRRLKLKYRSEVPSKVIGQAVLTELKKLDQVAYLRFASVYRQFQNPVDFAKELDFLETAKSN
ncbi:transcriptional repressor NrdR [Candidatus Daviesbacteria bacterium]|nr:transcriptional repressor NrdR [Candidatus Daviesbacteria bacterium]